MFVPVHRLDSIQITTYRSSQLRPVRYHYKPEIDHGFPRHRTIRTTQICRPAQSRPSRPTLKPRRRPTPSRQPLRSSLSPNSSISSSKPCLARRGLHFVKCRKHGQPPYRNSAMRLSLSAAFSSRTTCAPGSFRAHIPDDDHQTKVLPACMYKEESGVKLEIARRTRSLGVLPSTLLDKNRLEAFVEALVVLFR
jgi:hypothetical protein